MAFTIVERLYYTADKKRLVRHGDPAAAFLAFTPGQVLPDPEALRLGVVAFYAAPVAPVVPVVKQGRVPVNKMAARPADKTEIKEIIK